MASEFKGREPSEEETNPAYDQEDYLERRRAVLEIKLYSWTTPVIAVVMLAIGLLAGYFGRPLFTQGRLLSATPEASTLQTSSTPNPSQDQAGTPDNLELMEFLLSQTRHFKGDPDAPVVMIEFSDYQ